MFKKASLLFIMLGLLVSGLPASAYVNTDYTIDGSGERQAIPVTYTCTRVYRNLGTTVGFMNMPEDLFIDQKGLLYVADSGNNRIIRINPQTGETSQITGPEDIPLSEPKGVYVDNYGDIFVADTGNHRVVHMDPNGKVVETFIKPDSDLLNSEEIFSPDKIYVNNMNMLYVKQGKQFLVINPENKFEGYAGAPEVGFSFTQILINIFASATQKSRIEAREPAQYSNFLISDGIIYATSLAESGQIRKISAADKNVYPEKFYGEVTLAESGQALNPQFVDLAIDHNNILYAIDKNNGRIYQYDQEGNLLAVFGGLGFMKGQFESPVSLVVDQSGRVYVLDSIQNAIHIFEPTLFIQRVHQALSFYYAGQYNEAEGIWNEVLQTDTNYYMANSGIGNTLYKSGAYQEALSYFRTANDKSGYSKAYAKHLKGLVKTYFLWIILLLILLAAGLFILIKYLRKQADRFLSESYGFSPNERRGIR